MYSWWSTGGDIISEEKIIYADYAATDGYVPQCVTDAVVECMKHPGNAGRGSHGASLTASRTVYEVRDKVDRFFDGYGDSQVAFTSGITESLNIVIKGLLNSGDHVITTYAEHNSILRPLYEMEQKDVEITVTEPDVKSIELSIKNNTRAVVMTHASNVTGDLYDIRAIGRLCSDHNILFIVDTAQTAGIYRISMQKDNIDVLCFTGHKGIMGPQGIGGICIRDGIAIRPLKTGGSGVHSFDRQQPQSMPTLLEAGTLNTPGIAGLGAAIDFIEYTGMDVIRNHTERLSYEFRDMISDIGDIKIYQDECSCGHTAITALNITDYDAAVISDELSERFGIFTRAGAHCAPLMHKHLGTVEQGIVRFSFGYGTTQEEIIRCVSALKQMIEE